MRHTLKIKILVTSDTARPGNPEISEYLAFRVWQGDGPPILVFLICLQFLICKCDAIRARYGRTQVDDLLDEFWKLRKEIEERIQDARSPFLKN